MAQDRVPTSARVLAVLDAADRLVTAAVTPITTSMGISRAQWRVLLLLGEGSGVTMGEVAERAGAPSPTATRLADRLVADGLAYRRPDPWDRRRVLMYLSEDGRVLVDRIAVIVDEALGDALATYETAFPAGTRDAVVGLLLQLAAAAGPTGFIPPATDGTAQATKPAAGE